MEQRYWEQFMKTGGICDYLGYKMEAYGHVRGGQEQQGRRPGRNAEASAAPFDPQDDDIA